ncbi:MAG: HIT family protein [Thermoflavifilum aggregans]|nr:HIT family protein [Thermoflavifilum aggregans]
MNCPFCLKTEADFFRETSRFAAIYNLAPIVPGHSLIIPKQHIESLFDLPDEAFDEMMQFSRQIMKFLCDYFHTDAFDWAIQEKPPAGQSVAHLHLHLIPRYENDLPLPGDWYVQMVASEKQQIDIHTRARLSEEALKQMTERLKQAAAAYFTQNQTDIT